MNRREKILLTASRINDLRAELARLEAEFEQLVPDDDRVRPGMATASPDNGDPLPSRILSLLNANSDRSFAAPEILAKLELGASKIDQVRATLFRLKKATKIRKVRKGKYRALSRSQMALSVIPAAEEPLAAALGG